MTAPRQPGHDSILGSPVDWHDIPLGPGQSETNRGKLQWTGEGNHDTGRDTRRKPGEDHAYVVIKPVNGATI